MNQVSLILESNAPLHRMSDRLYKGRPPIYAKIINPETKLEEFVKTSKGIPFVRYN